jgi:hypothetical protein
MRVCKERRRRERHGQGDAFEQIVRAWAAFQRRHDDGAASVKDGAVGRAIGVQPHLGA